jgi:hypothetical protein
MQGTIVMLMALSGLGCHHKSCEVAFAPSYFTSGACYSGCYGDGFSTVVEPSCYSSCYSSGYSGCYNVGYGDAFGCCGGYGYDDCGYGGCGGYRGCGLLKALFGCFGGWGRGCGLFGRCHRNYDYCYAADLGCYSPFYSDYGPADFGSGMPIYETPIGSGHEVVEPAPSGTPVPGPSVKPREPTSAPPSTSTTPSSSIQPEETTTPPPPAPGTTTPPKPPIPAPPSPPAGESLIPKAPTPAIEKPRI